MNDRGRNPFAQFTRPAPMSGKLIASAAPRSYHHSIKPENPSCGASVVHSPSSINKRSAVADIPTGSPQRSVAAFEYAYLGRDSA